MFVINVVEKRENSLYIQHDFVVNLAVLETKIFVMCVSKPRNLWTDSDQILYERRWTKSSKRVKFNTDRHSRRDTLQKNLNTG
jgi:hypothetical protein